ncbi:MAG: S8 family peptidase [Planctomycetes bacterium]|nr:S8 family peptidase [Planctomycetota bacterium]
MHTHTRFFWGILATFATACSGGGGGGGDDSIHLSGTVAFVPETVPLTAGDSGHAIDATRALVRFDDGRSRLIRSTLESGRDALKLRAGARVAVTARVVSDGDVRIAHLDPVSLALGAPASEVRFLARGPFELVAHGQNGPYEVVVSAHALGDHVELEGHLGTFLAGDELALRAHDGARAKLSCAEALELSITASGALSVRDIEGFEIARIPEGGGETHVPAAMLQSIELVASGEHPRTIALEAQPASGARPMARVHSAELERSVFGLAAFESAATEVTHEFVPGEVLVRAREGATLDSDMASRSARLEQRIPDTSDLLAFDLPSGLDAQDGARTTLAAIAAFEASERVEWAEPNRIRRASAWSGGATTEPNDTFYTLQKWHYDLINMPRAWNLSQGSSGVVVAVIDTGLRTHPDLDANLTNTGFDFISSASNAGDGGGIDADPTDPGDGNGLTPSSFHGTHVAGTIGAVGNNGSGVTGVNWDVSIMHLRVLGLQGGTDADIAQAVRYAAGLSNSSGTTPAQAADVINMSLGGPGSTQTMQSAVSAARNAGVVIFAAAGNENSSLSSFPASYTGVVSVSAVDRNANKAPYSNFGPKVDIAAPGGDTSVDLDGDGFVDGVLSTLVDENNAFAPNFVFYQGTSMACPHAAGVAALMLAVNGALTPAEIENFLQDTAVDLGAAGRDNIFGHGLIQADLAVAAAAGSTNPNPVIQASPAALNFGTAATLLSISISNVGGGTLDVGTPTFTPNGADPVFATLATVAGTGNTDITSVRVTVDRGGLADGTYSGVVSIPTVNGGTAQVDVSMDVTTAPAPVDVDLFLLLVRIVDPDTFDLETIAQADLNPTTVLDWELDSDPLLLPIPAGDYILVCGSDEEGDLDIGDTGDIYFGAYPTLDEVEILDLFAGKRENGLDFVVAPAQSTLAPNSPYRRPFRLLRAPHKTD